MKKNFGKKILTFAMAGFLALTSVTVPVKAAEAAAETSAVAAGSYVMMNIPYAEFYAAETAKNDVEVDTFTSATKSKGASIKLAGASYHESAEEVLGVTYPVKVTAAAAAALADCTDTKGETEEVISFMRGVENKDIVDKLFSSPSYSYYVLNETPKYYKEADYVNGKWTFGALQGEAEKITDAKTEVLSVTNYGDFELDIESETLTAKVDGTKVAAVVITDENGKQYGLRTLENIWFVNRLAWCVGYTDIVHGCQTSSAHYANLMGVKVTNVRYFTADGVYDVAVDAYIPKKNDPAKTNVAVENADVNAGTTKVTVNGLQDGYEAVYTVDGLEISVADGVMTFPAGSKPGAYTLYVKDGKGVYADLAASFELTTDAMPAAYDAEQKKVVAAEGASAEDLTAFLSAIKSVSVDGTVYNAGHHGKTIVNADGTIADDPVVNEGEHTLVVTATGYANTLTFTYSAAAAAETEAPAAETEPAETEEAVTCEAPASVKLTAKKASVKAVWTTVEDANGYRVQYKVKGGKWTTAKTIKKQAKKTLTIKKLTSGKKVWVRVRAYKTVDGKKVWSSWTKSKAVKVK